MVDASFSEDSGFNVPIELPDEIAALLAQPICADISLPKPATGSITLPLGGSLSAVTDVTKQIPDNCAVNFSLLLQLGPLVGQLKCIFAVLGLIGPLIDVIKGLPFPPAKAIADFVKATEPVLECVAAIGGLGPPLFIKDVICLVISLLNCMIDQLRRIFELMNGLSIQLERADGNAQLTAALECAQENAQCAAESAMTAFEPIVVILELLAPLIEQFGDGASIEIPSIGPPESLEAMESTIASLEEFSAALNLIADALGGCD
ncbi:hypothetical protein [Tateyamaria omphalii]|uniref:Uncharacterized protein n=1 Tax=Tateyamaria omphalii TaxID=299262 RepID=A0A1P8MV55_9RHOB|nr:hypothetical protein [Tateyamaria omphalii]APX11980.1 hypothetical protein BWR18_10050 [Tateyamaria omphalii]